MNASPSVGFIGSGKMASALARGWLAAGILDAGRLTTYDVQDSASKNLGELARISVAATSHDAARDRDVVLVATRPADAAPALRGLTSVLQPGQLVISIAAGVPLSIIEAELPTGVAAIRVMPSTPCLVGAGASAYSRGAAATPDQADLVGRLFNALGSAVEVPERLMDAVTGLSGSGPAYAFIMIEALADGGVRSGLDRATALKLAAQTLLGAAKMVLETGDHPGKLKDMVASPGGTTIAGVGVLETRGIRGILMDAVDAATRRSIEMSEGR